MKLSNVITMLLGVAIITIIAPLSQFLTMMTVSADIEVATPVGWAMGFVFTVALAFAAIRLVQRTRSVSKPNMVILFTMLTVAVPVMNLGLVRQAYLSMYSVLNEYVWNGTSTYRTAYNGLDDDWFPKVPTTDGLAWNKADRLLRLLQDDKRIKQRADAQRAVSRAVTRLSQELQTFNGEGRELDGEVTDDIRGAVELAGKLDAGDAAFVLGRMQTADGQPNRSRVAAAADLRVYGMLQRQAGDASADAGPVVSEAAKSLMVAILDRADSVEARSQAVAAGDAEAADVDAQTIGKLGVDEAAALLQQAEADVWTGAAFRVLGLNEAIARQREEAARHSEEAAKHLVPLLVFTGENAVSQTPDRMEQWDPSSVNRIRKANRLMRELAPEGHKALRQRIAMLQASINDLQAAGERPQWRAAGEAVVAEGFADFAGTFDALLVQLTTKLSRADLSVVRGRAAGANLEQLAALDDETFDRMRGDFMYRLTTDERKAIARQDGSEGQPKQNLRGFAQSIWTDQAEQQKRQSSTLMANLWEVNDELPWRIWLKPITQWSLLFLTIFLFIMCLAEWLRRKWIDRENLAFPLVDIADGIIRHDAEIETAEDIRDPRPRPWLFNPFFLCGLGVGFLYLSLEAAGHYDVLNGEWRTTFDLSKTVFQKGELKNFDKVFFVISPIIIGIAFLISLELSFSVWMLFLIYNLVVFMVRKIYSAEALRDSVYTGWGGGRFYPFPAEQMLGAVLCFTMILLVKSFRTKSSVQLEDKGNAFIHPKLNIVGLIGLPIVMLALLWSLGITNIPLLLLVGLISGSQMIAMARARAETGLPTHHCSYEFSKLPMIFGLTGFTGATVYTRFITIAFLPMTLLSRLLPQTLENIELARRHRVKYGVIAVASLVAFVTAVAVGMTFFIHFAYYFGEPFWVEKTALGEGVANFSIARYPLWVSHFLGEGGLDKFDEPHWIRLYFMAAGFIVFGALTFLRNRFLTFPLNPIGYLLLLVSIYYAWVSPYVRGSDGGANEASLLWGSVLIAWLTKKLIIKYGGMNAYKASKPFFIGLVVGSILCVFSWNMLDLVCSLLAYFSEDPAPFYKLFTEAPPYSPKYY